VTAHLCRLSAASLPPLCRLSAASLPPVAQRNACCTTDRLGAARGLIRDYSRADPREAAHATSEAAQATRLVHRLVQRLVQGLVQGLVQSRRLSRRLMNAIHQAVVHRLMNGSRSTATVEIET
jgi:hypothetical protein